MLPDPWLERWLPLIARHGGASPVLEIGCGHGDDTATLAGAGHRVIGFDLSRTAAAAARLRVPAAHIECRDVRDPFPDAARDLGVVIASLSLHYFPWAQTVSIVERIRQALRPGGVLLCRLNSTEDRHFGQGRRIEENFYALDGGEKRFFDEPAIRRLFADGWRVIAIEHRSSRKYRRRKALWEVVLARSESGTAAPHPAPA